jgi:hypothetical protein
MFQPQGEKEAERSLIIDFAKKTEAKFGCKVNIIKLQGDNDDGKVDGIIEYNGKKVNIEVRRKGYPNHKGKVCFFKNGWETEFLIRDGGIFINELTIKNHKDKGFVFIVDINGHPPRMCNLSVSRIKKLLRQPLKKIKSTNSGVLQSVKVVPLKWFVAY